MDPFQAVGLAGNVVQFVDLSWKLLSEARQVMASRDGTTANTRLFTKLVANIQEANKAIQKVAPNDHDISGLIKECNRISDQLLEQLQMLKRKDEDPPWVPFLVALRGAWKASEIDGLLENLTRLHSRVLGRIHILTFDKVSDLRRKLDALDKHSSEMELKRQDQLEDMVTKISRAVDRALRHKQKYEEQWLKARNQAESQKGSGTRRDMEPGAQSTVLDSEYVERFLLTARHAELPKLTDISADLAHLQREGRRIDLDISFLRAIYFSGIFSREKMVKEPYTDTLNWIFENKHDGLAVGFPRWLEKESGVFWIGGKPGCGKSTLMKYLCGHDRTVQGLQKWASPEKSLVTAHYFFWRAGSKKQKSSEGLLRSLIFEVLRQCPDLISSARDTLPQKDIGLFDFDKMEDEESSWSQEQLLTIYKHVVGTSAGRLSKRFCFFIDGLDEYFDSEQHPERIVQTIHDMDFSPDVKLCISSRLYPEFQIQFGRSADRMLRVQDHTRRDIHKYVSDELNKLESYLHRGTNYFEIIDMISSKSDGVFLWVVLVVARVTRGIRRGDSAHKLRGDIEQYPPDLDEFFSHMLNSIEKDYRRQAMRTFDLVSASLQPLHLMVYWYLYEADERADPCSLWNKEGMVMSQVDIDDNHQQMELRLGARSHGLLEITEEQASQPLFRFKVDFIHRTVRDFLQASPVVQTHFMDELDKSGRSTWLLARHAILGLLNDAPWQKTVEEADIAKWLMRHLFFFAHLSVHTSVHPVPFDDSESLVEHAETVYKRVSPMRREGRSPTTEVDRFFMCLNAQYGYVNNVRSKLLQTGTAIKLHESRGRPVLDCALVPVEGEGPVQYSGEVVKLLLAKRAPIHLPYQGETVLSRFVQGLVGDRSGRIQDDQQYRKAVEAVLRILLHHEEGVAVFVKTRDSVLRNDRDLINFLKDNRMPSIASLTSRGSIIGKLAGLHWRGT